MSETRKLVAILVADVVGYSRLAGADEDRTLSRLRGLRSNLIDPAIAHHGRIVKRTGDGSIVEFRSLRAGAARMKWAVLPSAAEYHDNQPRDNFPAVSIGARPPRRPTMWWSTTARSTIVTKYPASMISSRRRSEMKIRIATGLAILSLAIVSAEPAHAASLVINDAVLGPNVMFSENDFEGGFELNGTQVQIGLGNPASQTVLENGAFVDGAAEITFGGSWIAASPIVPASETIFITEPGSALISDVLDFTYSSNPLNANTGELNGFVISDSDSTPLTVADLNAVGIFATATLSGADGPVGTFPNTDITASFQSDADGVPELPTWAMITVGFVGLGYAAFRRSAKPRLAR